MKSRVLALLLLALALAAALCLLLRPRGGAVAEVRVDGVLVLTLDLSRLAEPQDIPIGAHNVLRAEPGRVRMLQADCPDGLCVNMGWTSSPGKPLVCLPNGVTVTIRGAGEEDGRLG